MNEPIPPTDETTDREGEIAVCPDCLTENDPLADFCKQCARPLSCLAAMDPIKRIYTQGWIYRKAISGRTSPIIFWGMWLIFAPSALMTILSSCLYILDTIPPHAGLFEPIVAWTAHIFFLFIYVAILYRVTHSYFRYRQILPGHCEQCGCLLTGLPEPRCPECGKPFYPDDLEDTQDEEEECIEASDESIQLPGHKVIACTSGIFACFMTSMYFISYHRARNFQNNSLKSLCELLFVLAALAGIFALLTGLLYLLDPERGKRGQACVFLFFTQVVCFALATLLLVTAD